MSYFKHIHIIFFLSTLLSCGGGESGGSGGGSGGFFQAPAGQSNNDTGSSESSTPTPPPAPDTTPPVITIDESVTINQTNQSSFVAQGTCSDDGEAITGEINGMPLSSVCQSGTWSANAVDLSFLPDADYVINMSGYDASMNYSGIITGTLTKDTTVSMPVLSYVTPSIGYGNTNSAIIRVSNISNLDVVNVYDDAACLNMLDTQVSAGSSVDFTMATASEATYLFYFTVQAGSCLGPLPFIEDHTSPSAVSSISMSSPSDGSSGNDSTPIFSGSISSAEEGTTIEMYNDNLCTNSIGTASVNSGSFSVSATLPMDGSANGLNQFYYTLTDLAGNASSCINANLSYTLGGAGLATLPKIAMVGSNSPTAIISLENTNLITHMASDGTVLNQQTLDRGDIVTWNVNQGDQLESTGACYPVTEGYGTATWASIAYAGNVFTTYISRYGQYEPRIIVAAVEADTLVQVKQNNVTLSYANIAKDAVYTFETDLTNNRPVTITSTKKINVYFVTRNSSSGSYVYDARVLTPAASEVIGFAGYITAAFDGTTASEYRQGGSSTLDFSLDVTDNLYNARTNKGAEQYATIVQADAPVSITQIADYDGVNASPSLPTSMLSTLYGLPRNADYVAFAAPNSGTVTIYDETGLLVSTQNLTRNVAADANAPYAYRHYTSGIVAGYTYECSTPCYAYYDDEGSGADKDETLMMGVTP